MKKRRIDIDMPVGKLKRIDNFLPSPEELVFPARTVKVTLNLNEKSVEFFKNFARKHRTKYQKLIRDLLDRYAQRFDR